MKKNELVLIGGGGHCKSCIDVIEKEGKYKIGGIIDSAEKLHQKVLGYKIIAADYDLPRILKEYKYFLIAFGQIKSASKRLEFFRRLKADSAEFPIIKSPLAYVSPNTKIGEGTIVMHHALVNTGAKIGCNCIINSKALIEHDAVIEDHCHISTGAIINGGTRVGSSTFVGSQATIREYIEIGKNSVIGCAARIIKKLPQDSVIK